jgi:hypothetical protein
MNSLASFSQKHFTVSFQSYERMNLADALVPKSFEHSSVIVKQVTTSSTLTVTPRQNKLECLSPGSSDSLV